MTECCPATKRFDYLLWGSLLVICSAYSASFFSDVIFFKSVYEILNKMWWGVALGILFVGIIDKIPKELVISALGHKKGIQGILRATLAGVALDLCSHGILLVGMKLYERGVSLGQVMAFLIASPWNSFSLTLILWALIGWQWTICFIILSAIIAIISGLIFEQLIACKILPDNPHKIDIPDDFLFTSQLKESLTKIKFSSSHILHMLKTGLLGSKLILRWLLFGVIVAALIRSFMPIHIFQEYFGPTIIGLLLTIIAATIIEVCSEGSTPIAADLMTRAGAPGNTFAFLMTGVSTDYTEIMSIKETTKSWHIALFLPLVTVPQIILLGWILNTVS